MSLVSLTQHSFEHPAYTRFNLEDCVRHARVAAVERSYVCRSGPGSHPGRRKSSSHGSELTAQTKRHSNCRSLQRPSGQYLQRIPAKYAAVGRPATTEAALLVRVIQGGIIGLDDFSRRQALPAAPFQRSRPQRFSVIRKARLVRLRSGCRSHLCRRRCGRRRVPLPPAHSRRCSLASRWFRSRPAPLSTSRRFEWCCGRQASRRDHRRCNASSGSRCHRSLGGDLGPEVAWGIQSNMNLNEVISNRAIQLFG